MAVIIVPAQADGEKGRAEVCTWLEKMGWRKSLIVPQENAIYYVKKEVK